MKRTIKKNLYNRMCAQFKEAKTQGLNKVAAHLESQTQPSDSCAVDVRDSDEFYFYSEADFQTDVEKNFWNAVIRTADYYDKSFDAIEVQEVVEKAAEEFVKNLCHKMGVHHGVGAYESVVPGEVMGRVTIEVTEE